MLPAKWFTSLLLLTIGFTLYSPEASAQMLSSRGWPEWDSTNQVLFFISSSPDSAGLNRQVVVNERVIR